MHPTTLPRVSLAAPAFVRNVSHARGTLARAVAFIIIAACAVAFAPDARAVEIQVEGPQDTLAQPPAELSNHCTLRKAIGNANHNGMASPYPQCQAGEASPVVDVIVFNFAGTATLSLAGANEDAALTGDLDITDNLTIIGHPDGTTIDAADLDRVFHVHPGVTLTLINIHITNGSGNGGGGGIRVEAGATLILNGVTISSCHAPNGDGGAVMNDGTLNIFNSTLSGNSCAFIAGAIQMNGGTATITNSTVTANFSTTGLTGGINAPAGTTTLRSSVLVGNTNASIVNGIPNFSGVLESAGYNVIGDAGTPPNNGTFNAQPTDQTGVTPAQANLGPLAANGGPTPTHALLAGSIAIDKGHASGATADQRGLTRPCDLASVTNASGGDGGDAGAFELQGACGVTQQPPTASDDAANVSEDSAGNVINVLGNDTDPNGDALTVTAVTQGSNGSVSNNGTSVSYTPNADFFGADSFTYTISDGNGNNDSATVSVNVSNVNDAPVANNDNYSMNQDTTLTVVPAAGVLANDTDIDNASLSATYVAGNGPFHGSLGLNADGSFTYTPDPGYTGTDTFDYVADDGADSSNLATVTVNVNDTQGPSVNCSVSKALLWPPNSDLVGVGLSVSASDNDGEAPTVQIDVFSDEDDTEQSDGMSPDAKDVGTGTLRLRAERRGESDGRVYVIRIRATDQSNNTSYSYCTVVVPKSQSKADISSVNAQAAAAVAAFVAGGNNPPAGYSVVGDGPAVGPKQ